MRARGNVGLFTLGVAAEKFDLPHPRIELPVILVVQRVIDQAFELLAQRGFSLNGLKEDEITAALRGIIENDLRQNGTVRGFNRKLFEIVTRQQQVENYDLTKLTKAPDMCFKLRNDEEEDRRTLSTHEALFVECKPVDGDHPMKADYCDRGLQRFVDGDYAWAMEDALMVGYVRNRRTIAAHLIPAMDAVDRRRLLKTVMLPGLIVGLGPRTKAGVEALHVSQHRRGFPWVDGKGPATDIRVYHSWHKCD